MWSFWDAELFMCKIQREQMRHRQHGTQLVMSRRADNVFQKLCPRQVMHFLFTPNRPTVSQQFGNMVICSAHNSLHLRPWYGYLRTMSLKQFLSPFLRVLMRVLTSSSVLAQSNVQELVANAECLVYHAQPLANAMTLAKFVTAVEEWWNASSTDAIC